MEDVFNRPVTETQVNYAGFWLRLGAMFIDGLILAPITVGCMYFNIVSWKSAGVLLAINLVGLIYKPFMEASYGATFGKMAMNIKVLNADMQAATLTEVLTRNVFHLGGVVLTAVFGVIMFNDPGFEEVTGFMEYSAFTQGFVGQTVSSYMVSAIAVVDGIVMLVDDKKRSLHDKIAGTLVVETKG